MSDESKKFSFCGCNESTLGFGRRRRAVSQWKKRNLKWYVADRLPGISAQDLVACYARCFSAWQEVCGLVFTQTSNYEAADIIWTTRSIDGANGTLAIRPISNFGNLATTFKIFQKIQF